MQRSGRPPTPHDDEANHEGSAASGSLRNMGAAPEPRRAWSVSAKAGQRRQCPTRSTPKYVRGTFPQISLATGRPARRPPTHPTPGPMNTQPSPTHALKRPEGNVCSSHVLAAALFQEPGRKLIWELSGKAPAQPNRSPRWTDRPTTRDEPHVIIVLHAALPSSGRDKATAPNRGGNVAPSAKNVAPMPTATPPITLSAR